MPFWKKDRKAEGGNDPAVTAGGSPAAEADGGSRPETPGTSAGAPGAEASPTSGTPAAATSSSAPQAAETPGAPAVTPIDTTMTEAKVIEVIRTCYDPEIPVNIYELGLIYEVNVQPEGDVYVKMTLTSPMCPVAGTLPHEVEAKVGSVPGVKTAQVDVVWEPPWTPEKMSEAAKLQLGML